MKHPAASTCDAGRKDRRARPARRRGAVFIDEGGMGAGVVDRLRQVVRGIRARSQLRRGRIEPGMPRALPATANKRAEMWGQHEGLAEARAICPTMPNCAPISAACEYGFNGKDEIQLEKKDDMKKRGLASPDLGDALALTFAHPVTGGSWDLPPQAGILQNRLRPLRQARRRLLVGRRQLTPLRPSATSPVKRGRKQEGTHLLPRKTGEVPRRGEEGVSSSSTIQHQGPNHVPLLDARHARTAADAAGTAGTSGTTGHTDPGRSRRQSRARGCAPSCSRPAGLSQHHRHVGPRSVGSTSSRYDGVQDLAGPVSCLLSRARMRFLCRRGGGAALCVVALLDGRAGHRVFRRNRTRNSRPASV